MKSRRSRCKARDDSYRRTDALRWLHAHASESQVARLLDEEHATTAGLHCTEIPVFLAADNDPFFTESASWRERVQGEEKDRNRTP